MASKKELIDVSVAKGYVQTFLADPILKMAANAVLDSAPRVDAVPVVHGEWVDNGIPESILSGCSVCGFTCGAYSFNYCPNCGANMRGSEE